jgi:zinc protease
MKNIHSLVAVLCINFSAACFVVSEQNLLPFSIFSAQKTPFTEKKAAVLAITGKEVIENYIKAIGGHDKLKAVKALKITSSADVMGMVITGFTYKKAPNKFSNVMNTPMGEMKQTFDGKKAIASGMMKTEVIEGAGMENIKMIASPFPELDFLGQGFKIELKGTAKIENADAYEVEIQNATGAKINAWYDTKTGLKVQEKAGSTITILGNNKEVNGIKFPHTLKIDMKQMVVELKVSKVEVNPTLDDTLFKTE